MTQKARTRSVSHSRRVVEKVGHVDESDGEREKISITVSKKALEAVRGTTSNVSAFYDAAVKEKLYFLRLDQERARLEAEGVPLDRAAYDWILRKIAETYAQRTRASQ